MNLVQYGAKDIRTVSLPLEHWKRLIEVADLASTPQDIEIEDALHYATLNGTP